MDIMCRLVLLLLASLDLGCHICGQTTEMVQSNRHSNTTSPTQQPSHPVMHGSAEHTLQTSSPDEDSLKVTTSTTVRSEISQHTTESPPRSELSQHVADSSHQTADLSEHTIVFSTSVQPQITSDRSQDSVTSSTEQIVTSVFLHTAEGNVNASPIGGQSSSTGAQNSPTHTQSFPTWSQNSPTHTQSLPTHTQSSQVLTLTNSESSSRVQKSTDEQTFQSSVTPIATETSSSHVSHFEELHSSLDVVKTVETRVSEITEFTGRTFYSTYQNVEASADVTVQEDGIRDGQVSHSIQSSAEEHLVMSQSHNVTDLLPSETGYNRGRSHSTVLSRMTESSSVDISSESSHSSPDVIHITDPSLTHTQSQSSRTGQSSGFNEMFINTTAIVTSPSTVIESSSSIQSDKTSFSGGAAFYTNSTIFVDTPFNSVGKMSVEVSNVKYVSDVLESETEKPTTLVTETSIQQTFNQSSVLLSSYTILSEVTQTLSPYTKNMTHSSSLSVILTEQNINASTDSVATSVISPSSVLSQLINSSVLQQNISPTSVYQSVNTSFISDSSSTSIITTVTTEQTTSIKPDNTTTTTPNRVIEIRDIRFLFEFSGNCHLIQNNSLLFGEFVIGLVDVLSQKLVIPKQKIKPDNFSCGSLKIYVTFLKVPYHYITNLLKYMMATRTFIVKIYLQDDVVTFDAIRMKEVKLLVGRPNIFDMPQEGLDKVDIIVIIVACCICGILLSIGGILCIKECYRRKYAQSFDLMEVPHVNLKLEDFTLTRIPRPKAVYNEDNVTIQSYTDHYGQHVARGIDHHSKSNNGMHVRMNKNTDGIVIGVVGTSKKNGHCSAKNGNGCSKNGHSNGKKTKWRNSASSENSSVPNPSLENLLPSSSDSHTTEGAHNPVFLDDECASCSNDSYSKNS